jgi:hypothetical protein
MMLDAGHELSSAMAKDGGKRVQAGAWWQRRRRLWGLEGKSVWGQE